MPGGGRRPKLWTVTEPERVHPRYAHEALITLHVAGNPREARTTNVSRGGLCAELDEAIPLGTALEVDIQLRFDEDTLSEKLRIPATVAWCTTLDEAFQIGLAFRPLGTELNGYLTIFLGYLQAGTKAVRSPRETTLDKRFG